MLEYNKNQIKGTWMLQREFQSPWDSIIVPLFLDFDQLGNHVFTSGYDEKEGALYKYDLIDDSLRIGDYLVFKIEYKNGKPFFGVYSIIVFKKHLFLLLLIDGNHFETVYRVKTVRAITSTILNRLDAAKSDLNDPNWMAASIHSKGLGGTVKGNYQILRHPNQYEYKMVMNMNVDEIRRSKLPYIVGALQAYDNRETMDYSNGAISWSATPLTPKAREEDSNFKRVNSGIFRITIVAGNSTFFGFR